MQIAPGYAEAKDASKNKQACSGLSNRVAQQSKEGHVQRQIIGDVKESGKADMCIELMQMSAFLFSLSRSFHYLTTVSMAEICTQSNSK